jgi:two-component system chemotaxis family response regulator WspR
VTLSLGVASVEPRDEDEIAALVASADAALYEAKRAGRNRVASTRPPQ